MGTFRALSPADVGEILRGFGIAGYRRHAAVAAGTINTNVEVEAGDRRIFLRVNEGKSLGEVEREAAILSHVAARGVPTPAPLRSASGAPYLAWSGVHVSLFPWITGRVLARGELEPAHAAQVGRALATLHLAGRDFPDHRPGRYEPDEIGRRFERVRASAARDPALVPAVHALAPELEALQRVRASDLPCGLIHGDLFIDNVLYDRAGQLCALLDFEQAAWGRLAYDVAVTVLAFGFGRDAFRSDITRALLDGYREVRPPSDAERAAFGAELRFAACRFTVTRITDVHMRRAAGAPEGKDFRRYLLRLDRVSEHLARGDGALPML